MYLLESKPTPPTVVFAFVYGKLNASVQVDELYTCIRCLVGGMLHYPQPIKGEELLSL